jgi:hypothetical protein
MRSAGFLNQETGTTWKEPGVPDPASAFVAMTDLADRPGQGVAFLKECIRPVATRSEEQTRHLIAALDDDAFEARQAAERNLAALERLVRRPAEEHPTLP